MLKRFFRPKNELTDQELLGLYKSTQDSKHAGELFSRYTHLIYGVCLKYFKDEDEAQDATMHLFERLLELWLKHEITQMKSWIHRVASTHCLMELRKRKSISKHQDNFEKNYISDMELESVEHPFYASESKEQKIDDLQKALLELKEEQRICVELFFMEQCSYHQIVERTGYSLSEVKSHLQNGRRNLKKQFGLLKLALLMLYLYL